MFIKLYKFDFIHWYMEDTPINDLFICTDYTIQTFKYKDFT